MSCNEWQSR